MFRHASTVEISSFPPASILIEQGEVYIFGSDYPLGVTKYAPFEGKLCMQIAACQDSAGRRDRKTAVSRCTVNRESSR